MLLNQVIFGDERFFFGVGEDHLDALKQPIEKLNKPSGVAAGFVAPEPGFEVPGLADVEDLSPGVLHEIDAWLLWDVLYDPG